MKNEGHLSLSLFFFVSFPTLHRVFSLIRKCWDTNRMLSCNFVNMTFRRIYLQNWFEFDKSVLNEVWSNTNKSKFDWESFLGGSDEGWIFLNTLSFVYTDNKLEYAVSRRWRTLQRMSVNGAPTFLLMMIPAPNL